MGPKTATNLILAAGDLDLLLADVGALKNEKLRARIDAARGQILQNREMVRLDADLPLPVPLGELTIRPRYADLVAALEWCEFRSMLAEVRAEEKGVAAAAAAKVAPVSAREELFPF